MASLGTLKDNDKNSFTLDSSSEVCRRVCNPDGDSLLEQIILLLGGDPTSTPFFDEFVGTTTPGTETDLISFTVGAGITRKLKDINVSCRQEGFWRLVINDTSTIASGRTGPASPDSSFAWKQGRSVVEADTVKLKFTMRNGSPNNSDVEAYLQAID